MKTNVIRFLEVHNIRYKAYQYDVADGKIDGINVAEKIGQDPERVYKTLVTVGKNNGYKVFIVPVPYKLDLKKAAVAAQDKRIEMIKLHELEPLTGYVHGGCSPLCMKKKFPTFIEDTALLYKTIFFSAGLIGLQIEIAPNDLAKITDAIFADLI